MKLWPLLPLLAAPLLAQDLYLQPESFFVSPGERVTVLIREGGGAPPVQRLKDASMYTILGAYNMLNLRMDDNAAAVDVSIKAPGTPILAIRSLATLVTRDGAQFHDYLRANGLEEVIEWREKNNEGGKPGRERTSSFAKAIVLSAEKTDDAYKRRAGHTLEFVPDQNPYSLKPGAGLPVHVLLRGRPAANLRVTATQMGGKTGKIRDIGRTDAAGRILAPLPGAGKWRLESVSIERCIEPAAADWETFHASLTFELK